MSDQLLRLAWALPLVIVVGIALIHVLKRLGVGMAQPAAGVAPQVLSDLKLTEHTRFIVVDAAGQRFMVLESTANVHVQPLLPQTGASPKRLARKSCVWP
jgi:hypothetical protein